MRAERLVSMANDIGAFFNAEPDKTEAAKSVANHLKRFWDPRMRGARSSRTTTKAGKGSIRSCSLLSVCWPSRIDRSGRRGRLRFVEAYVGAGFSRPDKQSPNMRVTGASGPQAVRGTS